MSPQCMKTINNSGHVFLVINVGCFGKEYFGQPNVFHGIEPVVYVVGVSELKALVLILWLVFVEYFFERHFLGTKKIWQLCQVDAVPQVFLAFGGTRQLFADAGFDPSKMVVMWFDDLEVEIGSLTKILLFCLFQMTQVFVGDVLLSLLIHFLCRITIERAVAVVECVKAWWTPHSAVAVEAIIFDLIQTILHFLY